MSDPLHLTSRDNPLLVKLRKLAQDGSTYRKLGEVWLEGDHLCRAALQRGRSPSQAVISEAGWQDAGLRALADGAAKTVVVSEALFRGISGLESPARIGFVLPLGLQPEALAGVDTVLLDRLQDAGNAGSILRSAAALGVAQVIALKGSVALWSPKVLRAGMGAHFALRLIEGVPPEALDGLQLPWIATSSHATRSLHEVTLPQPCGWILGHEGQGVDPALLDRCAFSLRIPQPGGEESLNVASAAAICFYEAVRQRTGVNTRADPA